MMTVLGTPQSSPVLIKIVRIIYLMLCLYSSIKQFLVLKFPNYTFFVDLTNWCIKAVKIKTVFIISISNYFCSFLLVCSLSDLTIVDLEQYILQLFLYPPCLPVICTSNVRFSIFSETKRTLICIATPKFQKYNTVEHIEQQKRKISFCLLYNT